MQQLNTLYLYIIIRCSTHILISFPSKILHNYFISYFYLLTLQIFQNSMKPRFKINISNQLRDIETFDPMTMVEGLPPTAKHLKENLTIHDLPSDQCVSRIPLRQKRTSIDISEYGTQTINQDQTEMQSQETEKNSEIGLGSARQIMMNVIARLQTKKSRKNKRKNRTELKQLIKKQKIANICTKFIDKAKRHNVYAQAVDFRGFQMVQKQSILQRDGFQLNNILDNSISLMSILQITCLFILYTLALVFHEVERATFISTMQFFSLAFYLFQMGYNCVTIKTSGGRKLVSYADILNYYARSNLVVDLVSFLILLIDCTVSGTEMIYLRLFIIAKLPQCLEKMQKLQAFFIKNYYNQQYWSLIKVVLFNFCFAHLLAIFLAAMSGINQQKNWQIQKNIYDHVWTQRYIWSYYWGTTIMLTIGFGDITATTPDEALCLIVIQIFSVMCLAYNINTVGALISNIRSQDIEKSKNYKTFKQLSVKYELSDQLEEKINHYIEESVNIRKKFNLEEENHFLQKLPTDLKKEYLKESNRTIFYSLVFFGGLVEKTLYGIAQRIQMSISHPMQTLRKLDDEYNLLILRQGQIGFVPKRRNCNFNDMLIDRVKVVDMKKPFLLGLQFITLKRPIYEIKSLEYSVIYYLNYDDLLNILRETQMDYYHFCFLRDKNKITIDEFQVLPCAYCEKKNHTKFTCPKLHYAPLKQHVTDRQIFREKKGRNVRNTLEQRIPTDRVNPLKSFKVINRITQQQNERKMNDRHAKIANPFIDRLTKIKKFKVATVEQEIQNTHDAHELFLRNTTEIIKLELDRFNREERYEDEVWIIDCDKMKNYKDYFPDNNPCNLQDTFNYEIRQKRLSSNNSNKFLLQSPPTLTQLLKSANMSIEFSNQSL